MRILMLCTKYPLDPNDRFLTNELAGGLVAAGHRVQVVVTDWDAPFGTPTRYIRSEDGVDAIVLSPRGIAGLGPFIERASKWTLSSPFALHEMRRALGGETFDLLICFTPCVTVAAQLFWAMNRWPMRSILFVYDFFPHHHRAIGLVPSGPVFELARRLEEQLIRKFDVIGCIWPDYIVYLRKHHRIRPEQRVIWTPLWGEIGPPPPRPKEVTRKEQGLPLDRKILVFGGQITEGRGVEEMLAAATMAQMARPDLAFLLIGEGRLVELVENHIAAGGNNVIYRRRIPRTEYLRLISACDVGIVCTVAGVEASSFPSKTIDYLRAGLPIVAAVEQDSDYREFLRRWNIGISVPAGNATALFGAVKRAVDDLEINANIARSARACLEEVFDVEQAVNRLLDAIQSGGPPVAALPDSRHPLPPGRWRATGSPEVPPVEPGPPT